MHFKLFLRAYTKHIFGFHVGYHTLYWVNHSNLYWNSLILGWSLLSHPPPGVYQCYFCVCPRVKAAFSTFPRPHLLMTIGEANVVADLYYVDCSRLLLNNYWYEISIPSPIGGGKVTLHSHPLRVQRPLGIVTPHRWRIKQPSTGSRIAPNNIWSLLSLICSNSMWYKRPKSFLLSQFFNPVLADIML